MDVCVLIRGYQPRFYIQLNKEKTSRIYLNSLVTKIKREMKRDKEDLVYYQLVHRSPFHGFTNGDTFPFLELRFKSQQSMRSAARCLSNPIRVLGHAEERFQLYQSKLDPVLDAIHKLDIKPSDWLRLKGSRYEINFDGTVETPINVTTKWIDIYQNEGLVCDQENAGRLPGLRIMSFDIEADSSHGDFPLPRKTFTKLTQAIQKCPVERWDFRLFDQVFRYSLQISEVEIDNEMNLPIITLKRPINESIWMNMRDTLYDSFVKCYRKPEKLDTILMSFFPDGVEGDHCIQIGSTIQLYGEDSAFFRHIITLGSCDQIDQQPDTVVEAYDNERDVLIAWTRFMKRCQPLIVTGYNIFGFDFDFMWQRACELDIKTEFGMLSKKSSLVCSLVEQRLSSSALGLSFQWW